MEPPDRLPSPEEVTRLRDRLALLEQQNLTFTQQIAASDLHTGVFTRKIAHDLNNLLTIINGYSAMLAERLDISDDMRSELESIQRAGQRCVSLTTQLAEFGRKKTPYQ